MCNDKEERDRKISYLQQKIAEREAENNKVSADFYIEMLKEAESTELDDDIFCCEECDPEYREED